MVSNVINMKHEGSGNSDMPISDQLIIKWAELTEAVSPYYLKDVISLYEKNITKMQKEYGEELTHTDKVSCLRTAVLKVASKVSMVRTAGVCCCETLDDD